LSTKIFIFLWLIVAINNAKASWHTLPWPDPKLSVIYGQDDRREYFEATEQQRQWANSTVAIFDSSNFKLDLYSDRWLLPAYTLQDLIFESYRLKACVDEPYIRQTSASICSGVLIAPDLILTAGHCFSEPTFCKQHKIVFGYANYSSNDLPGPNSIDDHQVYHCQKVIKAQTDKNIGDFAIVQLDRIVPDHKPLPINLAGGVNEQTPLVLLGHPSGLPLKIAAGATVLQTQKKPHSGEPAIFWKNFYKANTDSYGGNSGSPVINALTGEIEGILVSGQQDYDYLIENDQVTCVKSYHCAQNGCGADEGETVARVESFLEFLPKALK